MALSARDKAILDFERSWWHEPGPKQAAIRRCLDISDTRYYQLLAELAGSAEAAEYDPLVVRRLRRTRDRRRRARVLGRSAHLGGYHAPGGSMGAGSGPSGSSGAKPGAGPRGRARR